ncbi:hypothetical protein AVEN_72257-1 [Araneus ventricosus]|uniref:Uncharacterized protein n=1 Tax=Araneus ventricosus TaxID=182803 RepID=A0A4Y2SPV8_ARAVE|nr:hypothetical protein AVEN_72257-1 [Araneus ventricosus]
MQNDIALSPYTLRMVAYIKWESDDGVLVAGKSLLKSRPRSSVRDHMASGGHFEVMKNKTGLDTYAPTSKNGAVNATLAGA